MKRKTGILALILAVIMLLGAMPLSLFAAGNTENEASDVEVTDGKTEVLDYLTTQATGSLYTKMAYADLLKKIDSDAAIVTEGTYTGTEGGRATFTNATAGATTIQQESPGPNQQQSTLIMVNGEAQMTDSSVSEGTNKAKTDVTFCYVPNAFTSKGYNKNGRTLYVASYDLKCGDAFKAVVGRLRIYQKQTVVTCTNGVTETKPREIFFPPLRTYSPMTPRTAYLKQTALPQAYSAKMRGPTLP